MTTETWTVEQDGVVTERTMHIQEIEAMSLVSEVDGIKSIKVFRIINTHPEVNYVAEYTKVVLELLNGTVLTSNIVGAYGNEGDFRSNLAEAFTHLQENL